MNTTVVYDIDHLYKYYPGQTEPANKDISLCILEGEIFGLLGDNGAGKTTLVKQMVNLIRSTSGNIRLYGKSIDKDPLYVPQHIGYMPQNNLALNNLTVSESIYFTAHLRGMSQKESKRECEKLIEQWNLEDIRKRPCIHISGGQKRLLQLSIALAGAPPILILDEPTNDLDPLKRKQVWEVLQKLNREHQVTIIFITHDAIEAEKIIQRIGIMRRGILVAIGKLSELKSKIDQ
jgi:ABC-2 type transport system ATP-binding protein